ncbi:MAG: hypothetical protein KIT84_04355 [Labilithrix sp.]|nr:hypothetical protein [Labilithrix sp.]MCW5810218.1 hypothetical protein [Labilithrix sp.]
MAGEEETDALAPVDTVQAAGVVALGLAACSFVTTFFCGYVVREQLSRAPVPIRTHVDAMTVVSAVLFALLFLVCIRAYLRARRSAARGTLTRTARLVPFIILTAGLAGAYYGASAAGRRVQEDEESAQEACASAGASSAALDRCLVLAIRCGRVRRSPTSEETTESCLRAALAAER